MAETFTQTSTVHSLKFDNGKEAQFHTLLDM